MKFNTEEYTFGGLIVIQKQINNYNETKSLEALNVLLEEGQEHTHNTHLAAVTAVCNPLSLSPPTQGDEST